MEMTKIPPRDGKSVKSSERDRKGVVVYVTASCVTCRFLTEYLSAMKVRFKTRDIVADSGAMLELAELTGGRVSVPVVVHRGKVLVNPDWRKLAAALRTLKG